MRDEAEVLHRFQHHPPESHARVTAHALVREACANIAVYLNRLLPPGDEADEALRCLERAMFWGNAALARAPEHPDAARMPTAETVTSEPVTAAGEPL